MFVRDDNGVEIFRLFANFGEPPRQFADTEAGVDQNAGSRAREKSRIAPTAAR